MVRTISHTTAALLQQAAARNLEPLMSDIYQECNPFNQSKFATKRQLQMHAYLADCLAAGTNMH